jgi:lysophospholipase L1-like esterase
MLRAVFVTLLFLFVARGAFAADPAVLPCEPKTSVPAMCYNIVFDGDSIAAGVGATELGRPEIQLAALLHVPIRVTNVAGGGRAVIDCLREFQSNVARRYLPGADSNVIVFHAGGNDIARLGGSADAAYRAFIGYVALAHSQGWKVLITTELPRPGFNASQAAEVESFNNQVLANFAKADSVVDLALDPKLNDLAGRSASGWYTAGNVHPNDLGYHEMVSQLAGGVRNLIKH